MLTLILMCQNVFSSPNYSVTQIIWFTTEYQKNGIWLQTEYQLFVYYPDL